MSEKSLDPAQHEPTDVGPRFKWIGVALLLTSVLFLALIVLWLFPGATIDRTLRLPLPQYLAPRLQSNPRADMERFYKDELLRLNGVGWVDKANGVAHIAIADAMRKVAEENIPGWPGSREKPPVAQEEIPRLGESTEKPHEVTRSDRFISHRAHLRGCWVDAGSHRHCVRTKARRPPPPAKHIPRRQRPRHSSV